MVRLGMVRGETGRRLKEHQDHGTGYSERWDAYFCEGCNVWIEEKCSDATCEFCKNRPERPDVRAALTESAQEMGLYE